MGGPGRPKKATLPSGRYYNMLDPGCSIQVDEKRPCKRPLSDVDNGNYGNNGDPQLVQDALVRLQDKIRCDVRPSKNTDSSQQSTQQNDEESGSFAFVCIVPSVTCLLIDLMLQISV